uniref:Uncharacterized protein n=1 Tax=Knipowitschia caucasica TaxID=637954 RepID=A0AAV2M196_KNICA
MGEGTLSCLLRAFGVKALRCDVLRKGKADRGGREQRNEQVCSSQPLQCCCSVHRDRLEAPRSTTNVHSQTSWPPSGLVLAWD